MINIKIDGVIVQVQRPFEFTVDGTEEYDKAQIVITNSTRKTAYPDWALIEIDTIRYVLQQDYVKRLGKDLYEHTIDMIEEVKLLEKIITLDRRITTVDGVQPTWYYHVLNLINTYDITNGTNLAVEIDTVSLLNKTADFSDYVGGTLLDHLLKIFRKVGAVPKLVNNVIKHNLIGVRNNPISSTLQAKIDNDELLQRQELSNIEDYASTVYTKAKNAVYESSDIGLAYYPYKNGSIGVRSSSNKYEDTNAQIECDSDIRFITKFIRKDTVLDVTKLDKGSFGSTGDLPSPVMSGWFYTCDTNGYYSQAAQTTFNIGDTATWIINEWVKNLTANTYTKDIDLTEFILPKNDWEKLEIETTYVDILAGKYQNNTFYYDNNLILNIGEEYSNGLITSATAFEMMMYSWAEIFSGLSVAELNIVDTEWYFEYYPKRDVDFKQTRATSSKVTKETVIENSQKDSEVELSRLGQSSKSKVDRIGNDKNQVTVRYNSTSEIEDLFNYDSNGYAITAYKVLVRYDHIDVTYEFAKNLSPLNINESTSNNRSAFTISNRQVRTNVIKNYNVVLSETNYTNDTDLPSDMLSYLLNHYNYSSTYDKQVKTAVYNSADADTTYIGMSVMPSVVGNTMLFHAQFNSPTVAGAKLVTTGFAGLAHKRVNINYTDTNGQVEKYRILYCASVSATNASSWPSLFGFDDIFIGGERVIDLNPDEILNETVEFDFQSDDEDIIVYNAMASKNALIKENSNLTLTAYIYNDDTILKYTPNTEEVIAGYSTTATVSINKTTGAISVNAGETNTFVIADSDGDLHVAVKKVINKPNITKVLYTNLLKQNPIY